MRSWISGVVAGLMALASSPAFAADAPSAGFLTSATVNFSYALKNICFAYVFHRQDDVLKTRWGVASVGWGAQSMFKKENMQAHLVAVAGRINVGVKTENGVRRCEIEANLGDPNALFDAVKDVIVKRPEGFDLVDEDDHSIAYCKDKAPCLSSSRSANVVITSTGSSSGP